MTIATTANDFQLGRVIRNTIAATRANFPTYFTVALICVALPDALFGYLSLDKPNASSGGVISMIGQNLVQAAVVYGVVTQLNGRRASFKECFDVAGKLLLPLLGLGVLAVLGIFAGLILFVVPGLVLICMWVVATPARVIEGPGVQRAFGRSATLTKGHRWQIFGLLLIYLVGAMAVAGVATGLSSFAGPIVAQVIVSPLIGAVVSVVAAAGSAILYLELRQAKEGVGPESLASVFD